MTDKRLIHYYSAYEGTLLSDEIKGGILSQSIKASSLIQSLCTLEISDKLLLKKAEYLLLFIRENRSSIEEDLHHIDAIASHCTNLTKKAHLFEIVARIRTKINQREQ